MIADCKHFTLVAAAAACVPTVLNALLAALAKLLTCVLIDFTYVATEVLIVLIAICAFPESVITAAIDVFVEFAKPFTLVVIDLEYVDTDVLNVENALWTAFTELIKAPN